MTEPREHPDNPELNRTTKGSKEDRIKSSKDAVDRTQDRNDSRGNRNPA